MREFTHFAALMESEQVSELVRSFVSSDPAANAFAPSPPFLEKFMALTMLCAVAEPDQDLALPNESGYAASGVCVFYVRQNDEAGEPTGAWEPWSCEISLGESLSYTFQSLEDSTRLLNEDDSCLDWQPATLALLARSAWMPLRDAREVLERRERARRANASPAVAA